MWKIDLNDVPFLTDSSVTLAIVVGFVNCFFFHLSDDIDEAYNLIKDLEPATPQEYILKGVVNAALGQEQGSVSLTILIIQCMKKSKSLRKGFVRVTVMILTHGWSRMARHVGKVDHIRTANSAPKLAATIYSPTLQVMNSMQTCNSVTFYFYEFF